MRKSAFVLVFAVVALSACAAHPPAPNDRPISSEPAAAAAMVVEVYKSPTCTCCHEWEAYMRGRGYTVRSIVSDNISGIKQSHRLPQSAWSCHTAVIGRYFIEGHVPVEAIEALLAQQPQIDGIALPGMPAGSPGMPGAKSGPFEVLAVADGVTSVFGAY